MATATNIPDVSAQLEQMIPGYSNLVSQAGSTIGDLLSGSPSTSVARNAEATFGAGSGTGAGSGVANRWGYDLYNTMGQQRQQAGLSDLNSLIGSTSGATTGQQNVSLGETNAANNYALGQTSNANQAKSIDQQGWMDQINGLIGLSNAGLGGTASQYTPSTSSYAYL